MQSSKRVPLILGTVLVVAAVARHRRAHAWSDRELNAWMTGRGQQRHEFGHRPRGLHGRRGPLAARFADCAERLAEARDTEYV